MKFLCPLLKAKAVCLFILLLVFAGQNSYGQASVNICPGNKATFVLNDVAIGGNVTWYAAGDLSNPIGTGNPFTTPSVYSAPGAYRLNYMVNSFVYNAYVQVQAPVDSTYTSLNGICLNQGVNVNANYADPYGYAFVGNGANTGAYSSTPFSMTDTSSDAYKAGGGAFATQDMTIEAWVKWTGAQDGWIFYNGSKNTDGAGLWVQKSTGKLVLHLGGAVSITSNISLLANTWQHVAIINQRGGWQVAINSAVYSVNNNKYALPAAGGGFFVGWNGVPADPAFGGAIDEVKVFNSARSQNSMTDDLGAGTSLAVGYYSFDNQSASSVTDGNNNLHQLVYRAGATVSYTNVTTFNWNMAGTQLITGATPNYTFTSAGDKTISLNVTDIYGCPSGTTTKVINVNSNIPVGVMASASITDTVCPGTPVNLMATGGASLINENFNTLKWPVGWSAGPNWLPNADGYGPYYRSSDDTYAMGISSRGNPIQSGLVTPRINTTGLSKISVVLNHFINPSYVYSATLQASTDSTTWVNVYSFPVGEHGYGNYVNFANDNITLPSTFDNQPKVWVRFLWNDERGGGGAWMINYVKIYSGPVQPQFIWSSNPAGFNSTTQSPEGVAPLVTTTYSVVQSTGCSSPANSVTVKVFEDPKVTASTNTSGACVGSTAPVINFKGSATAGIFKVTYVINEGPEFTVSSAANGIASVTVPTNAAGRYVYRIRRVSFGTKGCSTNQSDSAVVIISNPTVVATASAAISCSTTPADIKFTATKGVAPYTIYYRDESNNPQTITATTDTGVVRKAYSATQGVKTYVVTKVTDAIGCQQTQNSIASVYASVINIVSVGPVSSVVQNAPSFTLPTLTPNGEMIDSLASWKVEPLTYNPNQFVAATGNYPNITVPLPYQSPVGTPYNLTVRITNKSGCVSAAAPIVLNIGGSNNSLSGLSLAGATLSPSFNTATTYYTLTQDYTRTSTALTAVTVDPVATVAVKVNGVAVPDPASFPTPKGVSTIVVSVTAQDGTIKNYNIKINRPWYDYSDGTAVAYSLNRLFSLQSTAPIIRVRRSRDNAELGIGVTDINQLDTVALKNFVGNDNGYVSVWYDQSGNGRDASQTDASKQPRLVTNGTIERKNGQPVLYFGGNATASVYLTTGGFNAFSNGFSMFVMAGVKANGPSGINALVNKSTGLTPAPWLLAGNFLTGNGTSNAVTVTLPTPFTQAAPFSSWCFTAAPNSTTDVYYGLAPNGSAGNNAALADNNSPLVIGSISGSPASYLDGWVGDIVIYPSKLSGIDRVSTTNMQVARYMAPPVIKAVTGMPAYNATITITGAGFTGSSAVSFGGIPAASYTIVNDSTITAVLSTGASGNVLVTAGGGTAVKQNFYYGSKAQNAVSFNDVNQYIKAKPGTIVSGSYTVEAWVKPAASQLPGNLYTILSTRNGGDQSFDINITGFNTIRVNIGDGTQWLKTNADAIFAYDKNRWLHIACTVTPAGYTIYANGDRVGQGTFTTAGTPLLYDAAHTLSIGAGSNMPFQYFYGAIDEVRVYNTALTQADIQADMRGIAVARTANIKNYFNFDQPDQPYDMADTATPTIAQYPHPAWVGSYAFMSPTAKTATNITATGFTASWWPPTADTVTSYYLDVATSADFSTFVNGYNAKMVTGKTFNVTGLTQGIAYWYRVRPKITGDANSEAPASNIITLPVITSFTPTQLASGIVTIKGVNFTGATVVTFGGVPAASFTVVDDATITADIGSAVNGLISITTPGGIATKGGLLIGDGPGTAINFAANGQYATANAGTNISGNFTVEAWVKPSSNAVSTILTTRVPTIPNNDYFFDMKLQNGNTLAINVGNGYNAWVVNAAIPVKYEAGRWYHIAYVASTQGYAVYVNGNRVGGVASQTSINGFLYQQGNPLVIGANSSGNESFQGAIDEVRIYNTGLSQDNVRYDMRNATAAIPTNLITYYNFNGQGDVVLQDKAGAMNASVKGNPAYVESYALVIPLAAASNITSAGFTAKWLVPKGTVNNYVVDLTTKSDFTALVSGYNAKTVTDTFVTVTGLDSTKNYWLRVKAVKTDLGDVGAYFTIAIPRINSFTPTTTLQAGTVVIKGINLTSATAVSFGGTPAATFTVNNDTTLTAIVATGSTGDVSVTVPGGTITKSGFVYGSAPGYALRFVTNPDPTRFNASLASAEARGDVTGSYTVEAWVKPEKSVNDAVIISTRTVGYYQYEFTFDMHILNNSMLHGDIGSGENWITTNADAPYKFDTGRWYHIAYTVTPAGYNIYINGDSVGSGVFAGAAITPVLYLNRQRALFIGSQNGNNGFSGLIDEVRIYNTALTQDGVRADMRNIASAAPANLKNYYNFDQLGATTLADLAGTMNETLTGTTWVTSYAMVAPAAMPAANIGLKGFTANWVGNNVGVSNNYYLDVATTADFATLIPGYNAKNVAGNIAETITGLLPGTTYWYRVRCNSNVADVIGTGGYSNVIKVTLPGLNVLDKVGLDTTTLSSPAYSLRLLSSNYLGSAINVRRSSDNATQGVGFTASGDLDTATLKTFVGSGTGYVTTWYDQSGYGYNAAQTAAPEQQPRVVTNGAIEQLYGRPAVYFDHPNVLATAPAVIFTGGASMVGVAKGNSTTPSGFITKTGTPGGTNIVYPGPFDFTNNGSEITVGDASTAVYTYYRLNTTTPPSFVGSQVPESVYGFVIPTTGSFSTYLNGVQKASAPVNAFADNGNPLMIGNRTSMQENGYFWTPEIILFNAAIADTTRNKIEASQTNYYLNSDATLSALGVSPGTLTPGFTAANTTYAVSVVPSVTTVTVTPAATGALSTVQVNINGGAYATVASGVSSAPLALNTGSNTVAILVTAQNGTTKTYTVTITRLTANALDKTGLTIATPSSPAYSLRLLSTTYTGKAINVRRSSDNALQDIGFTANGDFDTTALKTFVGSNTGYVTTWYDQSGFGYDMKQADITLQPYIIYNGIVQRVGGKPAVYIADGNLATGTTVMFTNAASMVGVAKGNSTTPAAFITKTGSNTMVNASLPAPFEFTSYYGEFAVGNSNTQVVSVANLAAITPQAVASSGVPASVYGFTIPATGTYYTYINGVEKAAQPVTAFADNGGALMMGNKNSLTGSGQLWVPEVILFNSVLTNDDRHLLEVSQDSYYGISDTTLSALTTSAGGTSPLFTPSAKLYTVYVTPGTTNITVTATVSNMGATLQVSINGGDYTAITSGVASAPITLSSDTTTVRILVTAQSGATGTYTITVVKTASLTWAGLVSSNWSAAANWNLNVIPAKTDNVTIPAGTPYAPVITGTAPMKDITIAAGARLTVTGIANIAGNVKNNGVLDASAGSLVFNRAAPLPQTVDGDIIAKNITLTLTRTTVTLQSGTIRVLGTVTVSPISGTLNSNGHLVLASTAAGTANVARSTVSNYIRGNVTVERYIPAKRAWRILTAPLSQTGSIYTNWQNGGVKDDTSGVELFKPGGGNGFTSAGVSASIRRYDEATNKWADLTNTDATNIGNNNSSAANDGFVVFVTGPYGATGTITGTAQATTLRASGLLQTGTQTISKTVPSGNFELIANPYASPINFTTVGKNNINNTVWIWDANIGGATSLGGYTMYSYDAGSGTYDQAGAGTGATPIIQSGQAFFVQSDGSSATAGVTIQESDKATSTSSNNGTFFAPTGSTAQQLRITLNKGIDAQDGILLKFGNSYKKDQSDDGDKLFNYNENISIKTGSKYLGIERMPLPAEGDTTHLMTYFLKASTRYSFTLQPQNIDAKLKAYLVDNYTNTKTAIDLAQTSEVAVTTTADKASYAIDRYVIVYAQAGALASNKTTVSAALINNAVKVVWTTAGEQGIQQYVVERSADGQVFSQLSTNTQPRNTGHTEGYTTTDEAPATGNNYYRIKVVDKDATITYSNTVAVKVEQGKPAISIYPNPVVRKQQLHITLQSMQAGKYTMLLYNTEGKQVTQRLLQYDGLTATQTINLPLSLAAGSYRLVLLDAKGNEWKQQVIVQ